MENETKIPSIEDCLLHPLGLKYLEEISGISPERAIEIWKMIIGLDEKKYFQKIYDLIYDLGLDPMDDEILERGWPTIYFGLDGVEKVFAGVLLGYILAEQLSECIRD